MMTLGSLRAVRRPLHVPAIATGLALSLLVACSGSRDAAEAAATDEVVTEAVFEPGGEIRRASSEPTALDPDLVLDTEGFTVSRLLYTPLVQFEEDLEIVPGVATDWEVSPDGLTYTFHLGDSRFAGGRKVTAEDFAYSFRRQVDPDTMAQPDVIPIVGWNEAASSEPNGVVGDVDLPGVEAPDDDTLVVTLSEPYSLLLPTLAGIEFAPLPAEQLATPEQAAAYAEMPIGNGPYQMATPWQHNDRITLVRNPEHTGEPGLADRIVFEIFTDTLTGYRELQAGNLDISSVPVGQYASAEAEFGDRYIETESSFVVFVGFHIGDGQPTDDVNVRRALSLSIDREGIAERVAENAATPATGFSPQRFPGAAESDCEYMKHDPERARELYEASEGFPGDRMTAYYPAGVGFDEAVQVMGNDISSALGVEATFTPVEFAQLVAMQQAGIDAPYGMGWQSSLPSAYGFLQPAGDSAGDANDGYHNAEFDELMEQVRGADTPEEADSLLKEAQVIACDELPVVPLVFSNDPMVHSPRVENVTMDDLGTQMLERFAVTG